MKKGTFTWLRSWVLKAISLVLAFIVIAGSLPSEAATEKNIKVKTKKKLLTEIDKTAETTITFTTSKSLKITIPANDSCRNKKLIVNAPNAILTNKAVFKEVTLNKIKGYTEKCSGNSIAIKAENAVVSVAAGSEVKEMTIEGAGVKVTVAKGGEVKTMNVASRKVDISILEKAKVGDLVCDLNHAEVNLNVKKNADVNVTLLKSASLTVASDKDANVDVTSKVDNVSEEENSQFRKDMDAVLDTIITKDMNREEKIMAETSFSF